MRVAIVAALLCLTSAPVLAQADEDGQSRVGAPRTQGSDQPEAQSQETEPQVFRAPVGAREVLDGGGAAPRIPRYDGRSDPSLGGDTIKEDLPEARPVPEKPRYADEPASPRKVQPIVPGVPPVDRPRERTGPPAGWDDPRARPTSEPEEIPRALRPAFEKPKPASPPPGRGTVGAPSGTPKTVPLPPEAVPQPARPSRPMPVEPDGGIGDGAGPVPLPSTAPEGPEPRSMKPVEDVIREIREAPKGQPAPAPAMPGPDSGLGERRAAPKVEPVRPDRSAPDAQRAPDSAVGTRKTAPTVVPLGQGEAAPATDRLGERRSAPKVVPLSEPAMQSRPAATAPAEQQSAPRAAIGERRSAPKVEALPVEPAARTTGGGTLGARQSAPRVEALPAPTATAPRRSGSSSMGSRQSAPMIETLPEETSAPRRSGSSSMGSRQSAPTIETLPDETSAPRRSGSSSMGSRQSAPTVETLPEETSAPQRSGSSSMGQRRSAPRIEPLEGR